MYSPFKNDNNTNSYTLPGSQEMQHMTHSSLSDEDQLTLELIDGFKDDFVPEERIIDTPNRQFWDSMQQKADYVTSMNNTFEEEKRALQQQRTQSDAYAQSQSPQPQQPYTLPRQKIASNHNYKSQNLTNQTAINEGASLGSPVGLTRLRVLSSEVDEYEYESIMNLPPLLRMKKIYEITQGKATTSRTVSSLDNRSNSHLSNLERQSSTINNNPHKPLSDDIELKYPKTQTGQYQHMSVRSVTGSAQNTEINDAENDYYNSYNRVNDATTYSQWMEDSKANIAKLHPIGKDFRDPWAESKVKSGMNPNMKYQDGGQTAPIDPISGRIANSYTVNALKVRAASFSPTHQKIYRRSAIADQKSVVFARLVNKSEFFRVMSLPQEERNAIIDRVTKGRTMTNTPVRPTVDRANTKHRTEDNHVVRKFYNFANVKTPDEERFTLTHLDRDFAGDMIVRKLPNSNNGGRPFGPEYFTDLKRRDKFKTSIVLPLDGAPPISANKTETLNGRNNGYSGGREDGSYHASHGELAIPTEQYYRDLRVNSMDSYPTVYHEVGHGLTATPKVIKAMRSDKDPRRIAYTENLSRVPKMPKHLYLSNVSEMTNALRMVKEFSFDVNDRLLINSSDVHASYIADWLPDDKSDDAAEQRKRIPIEIRRLYYTLDQMNDEERQSLYEWIDDNNLMPQVNVIHDEESNNNQGEHSSLDSMA